MKKILMFLVLAVLFLTSCSSLRLYPSNTAIQTGIMLYNSNHDYLNGNIKINEYKSDMTIGMCIMTIDWLSPDGSFLSERLKNIAETMDKVCNDKINKKIDADMLKVQIEASNAIIIGLFADTAVKAQLAQTLFDNEKLERIGGLK